ncbi:MAG: DUF4250 domain-containing protein [Oscillospiraceae bacterium]|nr:DUF4250 domain-containing protein [Oscillospiraceae bacterium]
MNNIPNDPAILLSYINTQLRDNYKNLDDLCKSLDVSEADIVNKLKSIGYSYDEKLNRFR